MINIVNLNIDLVHRKSIKNNSAHCWGRQEKTMFKVKCFSEPTVISDGSTHLYYQLQQF